MKPVQDLVKEQLKNQVGDQTYQTLGLDTTRIMTQIRFNVSVQVKYLVKDQIKDQILNQIKRHP